LTKLFILTNSPIYQTKIIANLENIYSLLNGVEITLRLNTGGKISFVMIIAGLTKKYFFAIFMDSL